MILLIFSLFYCGFFRHPVKSYDLFLIKKCIYSKQKTDPQSFQSHITKLYISSSFYSILYFILQGNKSTHGEDLPYVFGVPLDGPKYHYTDHYNNRERLFSEVIMTYWSNFAHTG